MKIVLDKSPIPNVAELFLTATNGIKYRIAIEHYDAQPYQDPKHEKDKWNALFGEYRIKFYPWYDDSYFTRTHMAYYLSTIYKRNNDYGLCLDNSGSINYSLRLEDMKFVYDFIKNFVEENNINLGTEYNEQH